MLIEIIRFTPLWVWALLLGLMLLGWQQSRPRQVSRLQLVLVPVAMLALGLSSVVAGFARVPASLLAWLMCASLAWAAAQAWLTPAGARWQASISRLVLPSSWLPMVLILAIFVLKYSLGVTTAMHPLVATQAPFVIAVAGLSGALSGLFLGRACGLWRKAQPASPTTIPAHV